MYRTDTGGGHCHTGHIEHTLCDTLLSFEQLFGFRLKTIVLLRYVA